VINPNFKILKYCEEPYKYVIIENFLKIPEAKLIYEQIKSFYKEGVFVAANDRVANKGEMCSPKKYYVDSYSKLSYFSIFETLNYFSSMELLNTLNSILPLGNIVPDPTMEGGGVHITKKGGFLKLHTDFNQSLNLNGWQDKGGDLLLQNGKDIIERVRPEFNKAVYFETNKTSIHGHPEPLEMDLNRVSLAFYYYGIQKPNNPQPVTWFNNKEIQ
jgi:hypothetical protein